MFQPDRAVNVQLERCHLKYLGGISIIELCRFSEDVKYVFGYIKKLFLVACDDWNHVPTEVLDSKPIRIHLGYTKGLYMYNSLVIGVNISMLLFYILYTHLS